MFLYEVIHAQKAIDSDEMLTQVAAESGPSGRAAASPADVVAPAPILTLTGLTALLSKMTFWAFCPHQTHTHMTT